MGLGSTPLAAIPVRREPGTVSSAGARSFRGLDAVAYRAAAHSEDTCGSRNLKQRRHERGDSRCGDGAVVSGFGSIIEQDPPNMLDGTGSGRRDGPTCHHGQICPDDGFPGSEQGARPAGGAPRAARTGNKRTIDRLWRHGHHVSMQGRFLPLRGGGGGQALSPSTIQRRVSAGSITSSISNREAVLIALPCSYMPATRSS